jgi:predicted lipid-binding transport protein (Tim44 family)
MLSYIGPGGALSTIGAFLALLAAALLALLGFVWYPIKRLLRSRKQKQAGANVRSDVGSDVRSDESLSSPAAEPAAENGSQV